MSGEILRIKAGEKLEPVWKWLGACTGGSCAHCKEPLLKYRDNLVTYKGENFHVHCLLDRLTAPVQVLISKSDHTPETFTPVPWTTFP